MASRLFLIPLFAVLFAVGPLLADTLLTVKVRDSALPRVNRAEQEEVTTIWIGQGKARTNNQYKSMILDGPAEKVYVINHEQKLYHELPLPIDFLTLIPLTAVAPVEAQLKAARLDFELQPTGAEKEIGEWTSKGYRIDITNPAGRRTEVEVWMTSSLDADLAPFKKLAHELAGLQPLNSPWMRQANRLEGFPVLRQVTKFYETDQSVRREELLSVETKPAPEGNYRPPADYTLAPYSPAVRQDG